MKPEYLSIKRIPFLVRDSLELAQRIDNANAERIMNLAQTKPTMPEERHIKRGLALGLKLKEMEFTCPYLVNCIFETMIPINERASNRREYCNNEQNYQNCPKYIGAIK